MRKPITLTTILIFTVLFGFLLSFFYWNQAYPFYFVWDMDLLTTEDVIEVSTGHHPIHMNHPGFGMYLIFAWTHKIAYWLGYISILKFKDLANALNPVNAVAELQSFLRGHSPIIVFSIPFFLWLALIEIFNPSRFIKLFLFILLALQQGLFYHATMIRSELYSLFFWSLSIFFLAKAITSRKKQTFYLVTTGIFIGLCYHTKTQTIFFIFLVPLLFFLFDPEQKIAHSKISKLALINFLLFIFLLIAGYCVNIHGRFWTFASTYQLNFLGLFFALIFFLIFIFYKKYPQIEPLVFISTGWIGTVFTYFFMYARPKTSLDYIFYLSKVLYFRANNQELANFNLNAVINKISYAFFSNPILFGTTLTLLGTAFFYSKKKQRFFIGTIILLTLINLATAHRTYLQDELIRELILVFLSAFFILFLLQKTKKNSLMHFSCVFFLFLIPLVNFTHSCLMAKRLDINFNRKGYILPMLFRQIYSHEEYQEIMDTKYSTHFDKYEGLKPVAAKHIIHFKQIRRDADFILLNQTITHQNIGLLSEGFQVWTDKPQHKLIQIPEVLRESILIDNSRLPIKPFFANEDLIYTEEQYSTLLKTIKGRRKLSVITRLDLEVYFFADPKVIRELHNPYIEPKNLHVKISDGKDTIHLQGALIKKYVEIPTALLKRTFFIIRKTIYPY